MIDLKEKVALITGAAKGIGFSCAKEILRGGARGIAIADIKEEDGSKAVKELIQQFGSNKAIFIKIDVTKEDQFKEAFEKTISTWKTIDVLINNAGIFNDKQYELEIAVNATSVVRGTILGLQYMSKEINGKGGVIVNMASIAGLQGETSFPVYSGTKHFVIGLSRSIGTSYYYDRTGVKIVTVCPGFTDTPLVRSTKVSDQGYLYTDLWQMHSKAAENIRGQPSESVAAAVIKSIKEGENGSAWVAEDCECYEIIFPDRKTLRKQ